MVLAVSKADKDEAVSVDYRGNPVDNSKTGGWLAAGLILGTELSERVCVMGISMNLVTYLVGDLHLSSSKSANTVTNFMGALNILALFGGFLADAKLGRYLTIAIFASICALGVTLLTLATSIPSMKPPHCDNPRKQQCIEATGSQLAMLYVALYTIALGGGGIKSNVSGFGSDQFDISDPKEEKSMVYFFNRFYFCISLGSLFAVTVLVYLQDNVGRGWGYGISAGTMVIAVIVLLCGTTIYRYKKPQGSPLTVIWRVVFLAVKNRNLTYPANANYLNGYENSTVPHTTKFSHTSQASTGMGSSNAPTILQILETTRDPEIFGARFDLVLLSDGTQKAYCKGCKRFLAKDANSTHRKHMNKYCPAIRANAEAGQSSLTREGGLFLYDEEACRQQFTNFVIQEGLPFNHFDNPRLTKVIQNTLQPRYNNVSRATLKRDCMKLWKKSKQELIVTFENISSVNLTTDVWSAPHGIPGSYLCVTAHWIDLVSWQMLKRAIAFENFEYPHTAQNLFYLLRDVLRMYKLEHNFFSISFDNASNNTSAVRRLVLKYTPPLDGIFFHTRCFAHIINLVVQDGIAAVQDVKTEFRRMLNDVFLSGRTIHVKYMRLCKELGKQYLSPNWDLPTCWNSTYNMFVCALRQRETLQLFYDDLASRNKVIPYPVENWETIQQITDLLKVFKRATIELSGVYYPTSSLALNQLFFICSKLSEYELVNDLFTTMVAPMKVKLRKYFREIPPVITCAAAMSHLLNVSGVEMLIDQIVTHLDLHHEDVMYAFKAKQNFNNYFKDLFDVYNEKFGTASSSSTTHFSGDFSTSVSTDPTMYLYNMVRRKNTKRARGEGSSIYTSEFGRYIGTDFVASMGIDDFRDFNILACWKVRESQFPVLAVMAKDLLTVQASTVASESFFSFSGRVLSIRRTKLTPRSLEMCICLKDHLDASKIIQNTANLEGELDYEAQVLDVEVEEGLTISLSDEELALDEASRESSEEETFDEDL